MLICKTIYNQYLYNPFQFSLENWVFIFDKGGKIAKRVGLYSTPHAVILDIRSFTALSENMSPEDNFKFLNSYLHAMGSSIRKNNGFIDKDLGDGIMDIFPEVSTDAVNTASRLEGLTKVY